MRIVEPGRRAPATVRAHVDALGSREPGDWPAGAADRLRADTHASLRAQAAAKGEAQGVDTVNRTVKPVFGSLFPYAIDDPALPVRADPRTSLHPSPAEGGLTNAWGAAMLPFGERDLAGWPIGPQDLAEHYRAVLRYVPLAAEADALEELAPLHSDAYTALPRTRQMAAFLDDLAAARGRLRGRGAWAGRSRLAVRAGDRAGARRCRAIGLCLHGCPYGAIWTAAQTLAELVADGRVVHEPGLLAEHVEERDGRVRLRLRSLDSGAVQERVADRVVVACGALESTRLVLASAAVPGAVVHVRDSQVIAVPLLRAAGAQVSVAESGNTLAQAFLELVDRNGGPTVHVQVYGFNDLMLAEAAAQLRLEPQRAQRLLGPLLGRLLYAQLYLHSDDSARIAARIAPDGALELATVGNPATRGAARRALARLTALAPALRAAPLLPLASRGLVGTGNHAGGSLPMRERPGQLETDLLGRPTGFERVHVVDSSVFPTVPATTITLSVMANATRIASAIAS